MHLWKDSRSNVPSTLDLVMRLLIPTVSWRRSQGTWLELCSVSVVTTTSPLFSGMPYAAVLSAPVQLRVNA